MLLLRRDFLLLTGGFVVSTMMRSTSQTTELPKIKAIAFDAFPIFDPRPIANLMESFFPGKGTEIMSVWRTRQFEYQWLRALAGQYVDFLQATEDSLVFTSKYLHLDLSTNQQQQLMSAYSNLKVWSDVPASLEALRMAGFRLVFLSNMTHSMLDQGIKQTGLEGMFNHILSTDQIRSYKPDPRAYQMAINTLKLKRDEILFVAFAGWDAAGAKWFGYPTFWVNRLGTPLEELNAIPDGTGRDLNALVEFVLSHSRPSQA
jgi:2-haloacid dehalogenase